MSTYSLYIQNPERYSEEFFEKLATFSDKMFMEKHFKIGKQVDVNEMRHLLVFSRIVCEDNCTIYNYLLDKIEGQLDEIPAKKLKNKKRVRELLRIAQDYLDEQGCNSIDEALSCVSYWGDEVAW